MSDLREKVARALNAEIGVCGSVFDNDEPCHKHASYLYGLANAVLAALADEPRTVETVEQLSVSRVGTVIRSDADDLVYERSSLTRAMPWRSPNSTEMFSSRAINLPATVLYVPEADDAG